LRHMFGVYASKKMSLSLFSAVKCASIALVLLIVFHDSAYAYLDPGIGSFLVQAAIGALLGAVVAMKAVWHATLKLLFKSAPAIKDGDGKMAASSGSKMPKNEKLDQAT
jgi:hypothetical protein